MNAAHALVECVIRQRRIEHDPSSRWSRFMSGCLRRQTRAGAGSTLGYTTRAVFTLAAAMFSIVDPCRATAVGFQTILVPEPGGRLLHGAFWYPTTAPESDMDFGLTQQRVARSAPLSGYDLPLVVLSHGLFGSISSNTDVAIALAKAGFVVAAVNHDDLTPKLLLKTTDRSIQLHYLIAFALSQWQWHEHLDRARIGAFGFSFGSLAVLTSIGGIPNPALIREHCRAPSSEWSCVMEKDHHLDLVEHPPLAASWVKDGRIKAAVIAAPALGYAFDKAGRAGVNIPLQIWAGGNDTVLSEPENSEALKRGLRSPPRISFGGGRHA